MDFWTEDVAGVVEDIGEWLEEDFADWWTEDFVGAFEDIGEWFAGDFADWWREDFVDFWTEDIPWIFDRGFGWIIPKTVTQDDKKRWAKQREINA